MYARNKGFSDFKALQKGEKNYGVKLGKPINTKTRKKRLINKKQKTQKED